MSEHKTADPMEFLKSMWSGMGLSLPGMVTPTLDVDELDKRITDLKTVEGWLKTNLNMLQMTIQGLEVQRATISAIQAFSQAAQTAESTSNTPGAETNTINPFLNPALWPWNLMQATDDSAKAQNTTANTTTPPDPARPARSKVKAPKKQSD